MSGGIMSICAVTGCDTEKPVYSRGWCRIHYDRWLRHGDPYWSPPSADERFWAKVNKTETCWLWTAATTKGYGAFHLTGKTVQAHVYAYESVHGAIPDGYEIDHFCRITICVRPDENHLRLTTHKQNMEHAANEARANNQSSKIRGVSWDKQKKRWTAAVMHHGKNYHAGRFDTLDEAEAAAIAKRNELFTHNDKDRK